MARGIFTLKHQLQGVIEGSWSSSIAPKSVEYLVVAGGGGGANGGGGAGGLLQGNIPITANTSYTVTVGAGGTGGQAGGTDGQNSVFGSIIAFGGGRGSTGVNGSLADVSGGAYSGGSGGGAYQQSVPGDGTVGQGNRGGNNGYGSPSSTAGGGGGAGTIGLNTLINYVGASGGVGVASAISGTVTNYAGGGAGGGYQSVGLGGSGGGGNAGFAGTPNTGGGGGGYRQDPGNLDGGAGGSGIVVVRYPGNIQFYTGGTLSYSNGFMVHTFYSSGTLAPTTPRLFTNPDYQISRSLRFNSADGTIVDRAGGAGGNRQTWTWSGWVKRSKLNTGNNNVPFVFGASDRATGSAYLQFGRYGSDSDIDCLNFTEQSGGSYYITTIAKFRDMSAWYHIVCAYNTTQSVDSDRVKIYVNGVLQTITSGSTYPPQNTNGYVNNSSFPDLICAYTSGDQLTTLNGYMTEINFVDGQQLTPASFGYTEPSTGVWTPLQYTGSYGTRGYYVNFADNSNTTAATLGKDLSGNANNFTPTNFSVTAGVGNDSFVDSPTNYGTDTGAGGEVRGNYATLNPLAIHYSPGGGNSGLSTFSNGNLESGNVQTSWCNVFSTITVSSGKFYAEFSTTSAGDRGVGIFNVGNYSVSALTDLFFGGGGNTAAAGGYAYYSNGQKVNGGSFVNYGAGWTDGDIIGVALDMDAGTLVFYKNGVSQGTAYTGLSGMFAFVITAYYSSATKIANFGQRPFAYTAPSGYKALCTQNLPESAAGRLPGNYFGVAAYAANGGNYRPIFTGVDMATYGGLAWFKSRNVTVSHFLIDTVRGLTKYLAPNTTAAEDTYDSGSVAKPYGLDINSGSASVNQPLQGYNYVMWNWAAGGAAVTNTQGSLTSQVSANPSAGFSIVTYTGTGVNATVGHGIGTAPAMVIVKQRNTTRDWIVYHSSLGGATKFLTLDTTDASQTAATFWNSTAPNSTVFSIGTDGALNTSGGTYVAYCWAEIAGYSRFSSYVGNGAADGPFVYCGFRPRFIMFKRTNATENWTIFDTARDTYNIAGRRLHPSLSSAETDDTAGTTIIADILSNGFKVKGTGVNINGSGDTYIFAAYAESPLKYSRAR